MTLAARLLALALVVACGPAGTVECVGFLRMHGMLRQAQAQCTFERFNPEIVDTARRCYEHLGAGTGAPAMRAGAAEFDRMADLRGVRAACALIERHFPMAVR
ncbi:hypothetical protein G4G93_34465 [Methylobacterium sp. DB0501]|uniref:Uncharacterized protein n=2 Tax=Methylobacterium TaxID=407 RepID=A0A2R4WRV8_9HYPH|nr:hypothetical protein DA075_28135 [Methylobacterium currus]NGM38929.1 hypothetical protein [Methylobacterium sp. DB0501]